MTPAKIKRMKAAFKAHAAVKNRIDAAVAAAFPIGSSVRIRRTRSDHKTGKEHEFFTVYEVVSHPDSWSDHYIGHLTVRNPSTGKTRLVWPMSQSLFY